MSEHCIECGKTVMPEECSVSWDDAQPLYTCQACCEEANLDNFHRDEMLADRRCAEKRAK
jgi:hypothetical protein